MVNGEGPRERKAQGKGSLHPLLASSWAAEGSEGHALLSSHEPGLMRGPTSMMKALVTLFQEGTRRTSSCTPLDAYDTHHPSPRILAKPPLGTLAKQPRQPPERERAKGSSSRCPSQREPEPGSRGTWRGKRKGCLVAQSCLTLCNPATVALQAPLSMGFSRHISRHIPLSRDISKNTGVGCHALLQGIFPTHRLNPGLLHCRRILYCPSHRGQENTLQSTAPALMQPAE